MEWQSAESGENEKYVIPSRWLSLHYYEALNILFRVENGLRVLVYMGLKEKLKHEWTKVSIASDEGENSIEAVVKRRHNQAASFGYLGYPVTCPLMYIATGELSRLITSEAYWNIFRPYFLGSKSIVSAKLDEIISVRNALAHFRPIKHDDVETIKQISKHVLTAAESVLAELVTGMLPVPTNTTEKWYIELRALGTPHCQIKFFQSSSEQWVFVRITYTPPILSATSWGKPYRTISTLNLSPPAILREHPDLAAELIYITESGSTTFRREGSHTTFKIISLGFSRRNLRESPDIVKREIESILMEIEAETELVSQDQLARGKLVRSVSLSAQIADGRDSQMSFELKTGFREDDPPEWWGDISLFNPDFISAINIFPWMPTPIAEIQF